MDGSKWERYAALGGIVFVVTNIVGAFLPGSPPSSDDSATEIAKYFSDHAGAIEVATLLLGIGVIGLLWWFGSLWRLMAKAEGERPRLAVVALSGLVVAATLTLVGASISSTVALRIDDAVAQGTAQFFFILSFVLFSAAGFGIVVFVAAVTSLSYRTKMFATWINILGWVAALGFLISTLGVVSDASWLFVAGLVAFLVWCVWVVAISIILYRQPADAPAIAVA
jgi:hypothetical protein